MAMYHDYTQDELRSYCRTSIESLEIWARRLVHEKMTEKYGENYMNMTREDGSSFVKKDIKDHVSKMMSREPDRYKRPVDTLFIDQIIYFLCNQCWYNELFKPALDYAYPQGCSEAREFLNRLVPIRNPLSHSNPITMRQVERAICYSNDFVEGLKAYYKDRGEEQVWNVPRIIKVKDSLGNMFENPTDSHGQSSIFVISNELRCGDTYSVEIEVDPSFSPYEYDIIWTAHKGKKEDDFKNKTKYTVRFSENDVAKIHIIHCEIISKKDWHKYSFHDCEVALHLTVYPPIE